MKILVIGDSHGNISNLKHVLGFAKHIKVGAVIHTGDWNDVKSLETVFNYNIPIYTVLGNADIDPILAKKLKIKAEGFSEDFLKIEIDGITICITHNIRKLKENINNFDFIFCGHRHRQWKENNIVNPGALENDINFAVFDTKTKMIEFLNHDKV
jgi:putative phosphoesterase